MKHLKNWNKFDLNENISTREILEIESENTRANKFDNILDILNDIQEQPYDEFEEKELKKCWDSIYNLYNKAVKRGQNIYKK